MGQNTWIKHTGLDSYLHGTQFINIKKNNIGEHYPYLAQNDWITIMPMRDLDIKCSFENDLFSILLKTFWYKCAKIYLYFEKIWKNKKKGGKKIGFKKAVHKRLLQLHIILGQIWIQPRSVAVIISILIFFTHNWFFKNL